MIVHILLWFNKHFVHEDEEFTLDVLREYLELRVAWKICIFKKSQGKP